MKWALRIGKVVGRGWYVTDITHHFLQKRNGYGIDPRQSKAKKYSDRRMVEAAREQLGWVPCRIVRLNPSGRSR